MFKMKGTGERAPKRDRTESIKGQEHVSIWNRSGCLGQVSEEKYRWRRCLIWQKSSWWVTERHSSPVNGGSETCSAHERDAVIFDCRAVACVLTHCVCYGHGAEMRVRMTTTTTTLDRAMGCRRYRRLSAVVVQRQGRMASENTVCGDIRRVKICRPSDVLRPGTGVRWISRLYGKNERRRRSRTIGPGPPSAQCRKRSWPPGAGRVPVKRTHCSFEDWYADFLYYVIKKNQCCVKFIFFLW